MYNEPIKANYQKASEPSRTIDVLLLIDNFITIHERLFQNGQRLAKLGAEFNIFQPEEQIPEVSFRDNSFINSIENFQNFITQELDRQADTLDRLNSFFNH